MAGAGRVRARSTRGEERALGRSAAGAAVGVAEEEQVRLLVASSKAYTLPDEKKKTLGSGHQRHPVQFKGKGVG